MKLKKLTISLLALTAIPAAWFYNQQAIANRPAPPRQSADIVLPAVSVLSLEPRQIQASVTAFGSVESKRQLALKTRLNSKVVWKSERLQAGNRVNSGELLARLDTTDYALALAAAEQLQAEATLALQQAEEKARQAERDWKRAGINDRQASPLLLQKPQLAAARARLQHARAQIQQARRDLRDCEIRAPFDAVIAASDLSLHGMTSPGDTLANLISSEQAEVKLALNPQQIQLLDPASTAPGAVLAQPQSETRWQGKLVRIAQQLDPQTRLRQVTVAVAKPLDLPTPLLPGNFVRVELQGRQLDLLLALPDSAISAAGYYWSVEQGLLQRHAADIIFRQQGYSYVQAPQGQSGSAIQVVTKAIASYQPGMKVEPREVKRG